MSEQFIHERVAYCLERNGLQAAERHIELLKEGWRLSGGFWPADAGALALQAARVEIGNLAAYHIRYRKMDMNELLIDACSVGYEQLLRPTTERLHLWRGVGLWLPQDAEV
ncbi:MAG: hypothetical protein ACREGB_05540 [Candidatus Saccharimonadales bacterium]